MEPSSEGPFENPVREPPTLAAESSSKESAKVITFLSTVPVMVSAVLFICVVGLISVVTEIELLDD